jgi:DNA-binding transcriptional ArsR family regulator
MTYDQHRLSGIFAALADPTRRGIFDDLRTAPKSVTELAQSHPVSRPAVSQHLRVLESADLVFATPQGSRRIYAVRREGLEDLRHYLNGVWDEALTAYAGEIASLNKHR